MGKREVCGWTEAEVEERRQEYLDTHDDDPDTPFERTFCLASIPRQPPEYDGPERYCGRTDTKPIGSGTACPLHGGSGSLNTQNLDKLAPMKHGMKALRENVRKTFDDKDRAIYNWVVEQYPSAYDINIEDSPADAYDIHRLGVEIVRAERGRGYVLDEGEVHEDTVRNEEGQIVLDENGDIVTEKSEHYLAKMLARQDSKISDIEKQLGITRKERLRRDDTENAIEAIQGFAELGSAFINRDEKDYDPDDEPWENDED